MLAAACGNGGAARQAEKKFLGAAEKKSEVDDDLNKPPHNEPIATRQSSVGFVNHGRNSEIE